MKSVSYFPFGQPYLPSMTHNRLMSLRACTIPAHLCYPAIPTSEEKLKTLHRFTLTERLLHNEHKGNVGALHDAPDEGENFEGGNVWKHPKGKSVSPKNKPLLAGKINSVSWRKRITATDIYAVANVLKSITTPPRSWIPPTTIHPSTTMSSPTYSPEVESNTVLMQTSSVLFDMDGTLIDSSPAVTAAWNLLKNTGYDFLDLDHILASAHGYRTIDALRKWCKIEDEELLKKEVVRFEEAILSNASKPGGGIIALPGVKKLLAGIQGNRSDADQGWSVCTSSTFFYASKALPAAGLPTPVHFVTAESVTSGKPAPDPYLLGAKLNKFGPETCIVVEDAPTGIRSGKAAGCFVLATCTSHSRASLEKENPDFLVDDLTNVLAARNEDGSISLLITQPTGRGFPDSAIPTPADTPLHTPLMSRMPSMEKLDRGSKAGHQVYSMGSTPFESTIV